MIIRILMGLVVAPIASIGALYGLSMVMESSPGAYGASGESSTVTEAEPVSEPSEDPQGEPPLDLPYEDGEAAAFLADTFAGTDAYWLWGADSRADLASFSAEIAAPGSDGEATCSPSHVMLVCTLRREDGYGYSFSLQQSAQGGWQVVDDEVRLLNNS